VLLFGNALCVVGKLMPYLKTGDKVMMDITLSPTKPGELNYLISMLAKVYWEHSERNYTALNDIIGALESAKLEFYRRVVVPYEEGKIEMNGDVY
jgi:hypothetical protein